MLISAPEKDVFGDDNMNKTLEKIIKNHQCKEIDGVLIDVQTANAILVIRKLLKESNRIKFDRLPIKHQADFAWKVIGD